MTNPVTPPERITHVPANTHIYLVPLISRTVVVPDDE